MRRKRYRTFSFSVFGIASVSVKSERYNHFNPICNIASKFRNVACHRPLLLPLVQLRAESGWSCLGNSSGRVWLLDFWFRLSLY
jgi:hypothetical protein